MLSAAEAMLDFVRSKTLRLRDVQQRFSHWSVAYPGPMGYGIALAILLLSAYVGFYFQDEGYQWYAAQRVLAGEIPIRDFDSYDPGRYYFIAAVMALLHSHGWVAMRVAVALFAAVGIWIANTLACRDHRRVGLWFCLMTTVTFIVWLFPTQKLVDITLSIVLVALLAWLIEQPTRYRCFIAGFGVGVVAIFGRNHGLYGAVADVGALAFLVWVEKKANFSSSFSLWCLGIAAGYAPMLLAIAFVPDFWHWLWTSIHVYFEVGSTNNPVPIPWPWRVPLSEAPAAFLRDFLIGALLMALPIFGVAVVAYSVWRRAVKKVAVNPLMFAAALLSIAYTHHAYARAGFGHLAQAIYPMLIGIFVWMGGLSRRAAIATAAALCALSIFVALPRQPLYDLWTQRDWESTQIGPDTLFVNKPIVQRITVLNSLVEKYAPAGRAFMVAPYLPGVYPLFERRAPIWDSYPLFAADKQLQEATIARIQEAQPGFVLIQRDAMDGDPTLAYGYTNPIVLDFVQRNFVRIDDPLVPPVWGWDLYVALSNPAKK